MMNMSECETLSQKMKEESEETGEAAYKMKEDSKDKELEEQSLEKKKEHRHSVSGSSRSIGFHSPYRQTHIPPSPSLHSMDDLPISNDPSATEHHKPPAHFHSAVNDEVPPVVVANQFPADKKAVTMVDPYKVEEGTGGGNGGSDFLKNKKEAKLNMALLGLRITAFVLCMKSFVILAAGKQVFRIWQVEFFNLSFDQYKEFKYCLSVNVIAFVYSGLQICDLLKYLLTKKHIMGPLLRGFFNFTMDQILTYLLMSAASSAATFASYLESVMGKQKFVIMANASVALSYVAFVAFALTSLVSGYILYRV